MADKHENIRFLIRNVINEEFGEDNNVLDWVILEMFGWEVLREIKYPGNYTDVLQRIRWKFEHWGWEFIDY